MALPSQINIKALIFVLILIILANLALTIDSRRLLKSSANNPKSSLTTAADNMQAANGLDYYYGTEDIDRDYLLTSKNNHVEEHRDDDIVEDWDDFIILEEDQPAQDKSEEEVSERIEDISETSFPSVSSIVEETQGSVQPSRDRTMGIRIVALVYYTRKDCISILNNYLQQNLRNSGGLLDEVIFILETTDGDDLALLESLMIGPEYSTFKSENSTLSEVMEEDTLYVRISDDLVFMSDNAVFNLVTRRLEDPSYMILLDRPIQFDKFLSQGGMLAYWGADVSGVSLDDLIDHGIRVAKEKNGLGPDDRPEYTSNFQEKFLKYQGREAFTEPTSVVIRAGFENILFWNGGDGVMRQNVTSVLDRNTKDNKDSLRR